MGKFVLKVAGGKLVKANVELGGNRISKAMISGDFFMHPEDTLEEIERGLIDCECVEEKIISLVEKIVGIKKAQLIGVSPEAIAKVVCEAAKEGN